jgi:acid stress chaperone HdeB
MLRKTFLAAATLACFVAAPASAQVTIEMNQITCKDFAGYDGDMKAFVAAWMGGYFDATRNLNVVQSQYVKRNLEKVGQYCKKHKNDPLLSVVEKVAH